MFHSTSSEDISSSISSRGHKPSSSVNVMCSASNIYVSLYTSLGCVSKSDTTKLECVWITCVCVEITPVICSASLRLPYICYKRRPRCKDLWDPAVRNSVRTVCVCVGTIFGISPIAVTKPCRNTLITLPDPVKPSRITSFTTFTTNTTMVLTTERSGFSRFYHVGPSGAPLFWLCVLFSYSVHSRGEWYTVYPG